MTRKQTRRSVSMTGLTYQRLTNYCERTEQSRSGLVEKLLNDYLDEKQEPVVEVLKPSPIKERKKRDDDHLPAYFTF